MIAKETKGGATNLILFQHYTKSKPPQVMIAPSNRVIGPLYLHSRKTIISLNHRIKGSHFYVSEEYALVSKVD